MNTTDPASPMMKTPTGWVQGYNAQAAVNENGVVIAGEVTQHHSDADNFAVMLTATQTALDHAGVDEDIGVMLFDAGYCSERNIAAPGPDRLIATTKAHKLRGEGRPAHDPNTPIGAMEQRLRRPDAAALYAKRSSTVEPVFGQHKHARGFRRFTRRGLDAVRAEWQLINGTHNILKLFRADATLA